MGFCICPISFIIKIKGVHILGHSESTAEDSIIHNNHLFAFVFGFWDKVSSPGWYQAPCVVEYALELLILLLLPPQGAGIAESGHHIQFIWCWGLNPGLSVWLGTLSTNSAPSPAVTTFCWLISGRCLRHFQDERSLQLSLSPHLIWILHMHSWTWMLGQRLGSQFLGCKDNTCLT